MGILLLCCVVFFFFQAEDGIRDAQESRGLGDVYKRQATPPCCSRCCRCSGSVRPGPGYGWTGTRYASRWGGGFGLGSAASLYARSRGTALPSLAGEFTAGGAAGW